MCLEHTCNSTFYHILIIILCLLPPHVIFKGHHFSLSIFFIIMLLVAYKYYNRAHTGIGIEEMKQEKWLKNSTECAHCL